MIYNAIENGFDTYVGEGGSKLSGGQKQRIDLARAILKMGFNFDEPTSNLDIETERLFYQTLKNINKIKKITIILITHRLDYVKDSKIIVLNKGIIEAEGSHNNLLQSNNWYSNVINSKPLN